MEERRRNYGRLTARTGMAVLNRFYVDKSKIQGEWVESLVKT